VRLCFLDEMRLPYHEHSDVLLEASGTLQLQSSAIVIRRCQSSLNVSGLVGLLMTKFELRSLDDRELKLYYIAGEMIFDFIAEPCIASSAIAMDVVVCLSVSVVFDASIL